MLEILITMVIVATALFCTAGLQVYAMRQNQSGQFRALAVFLSSDIAERMEANKTVAIAGNYTLPLTSIPGAVATDCSVAACNQADLASWDLAKWGATISNFLPLASWQITQTSVAGNTSTYQIVINWTDRRTNTKYANTVAGPGETFSYTALRTITK
jgi:type IV pilus assembly protein PilV